MDDLTAHEHLAAARADVLRRRESLTRQFDAIAEASTFTTHDDEHDPEGATIAFERASVQGLLDGVRHELDALDRAEERLRAGTYGRCEQCGGEIAELRLDALPAAATCITCASSRRRR
ncbi:TraR/DksA family transcriptional regulator [Pseudonocardia acidicola]|uniref:Dksa/trar family transcriptional regulator n=1 Tax=Pseudonocardia acidicola TaxID=2724939 RepID=A0ABX1SBC8_9PSEU|nr:TraR/DksA C4-type zinc finger protein [Pseudonocardia acidicola]NMH97666.1 dksa/trar family transcriptional regulator [Pseudonocardia acidicola]